MGFAYTSDEGQEGHRHPRTKTAQLPLVKFSIKQKLEMFEIKMK